MKTTAPPVKFTVTHERDDWSSPHVRVKLNAIYLNEDGEVRNPVFTGYRDDPVGYLDGFCITAAYTKDLGWYGFSFEYRDVYSVTLDRAEAMVKLLRKVTKQLDVEKAKYGYPRDFATFAARVAEAVGAKLDGKTFGLRPPRDETMWASGERLRFTDVESLNYRLSDLTSELDKVTS